jgi:homoserine kinase
MICQSVVARVPATTANLGPGFDALGIALQLHNRITVSRKRAALPEGMLGEAAKIYFETAGMEPFPWSVHIEGRVPRSRGLGSSVTVRLGLLAGLNVLAGDPLTVDDVLALVIRLEGHPDNAVPAMHGGFAACAGDRFVNVPVSPDLKFVALIPEFELPTDEARHVLPTHVPMEDAVHNLQGTALLTAAFCSSNYQALSGGFADRLHQPYRQALVPFLPDVIHAARQAGALGAYLSGAGSTIMAMTLQDPKGIRQAMLAAAETFAVKASALILLADNEGLILEGRTVSKPN